MAGRKKSISASVVFTVIPGVILGFILATLVTLFIIHSTNGNEFPPKLAKVFGETLPTEPIFESKDKTLLSSEQPSGAISAASILTTAVSTTAVKEEIAFDPSRGKDGIPPSWTEAPISYPGKDPLDITSPFIVPPMKRVEPEYFDDAVFIGNSIVGMQMLSGSIENATYYTRMSLNVISFYTEEINLEDGSSSTIANALESRQFGKVYLMLGLNEMSWPDFEQLMREFEDVMDTILRTQPQAIFYVQSILPVEAEYDEKDILPNNGLARKMNKAMIQLCEKKKVWYLNVAEALYDENGVLPVGAATDGVHVDRDAVAKWDEYLYTHAIPET